MIFGMMKATDMLDEYDLLDWIRHSDISSAMIIAALEKGDGSSDLVDRLKKLEDREEFKKGDAKRVETFTSEWANFKRKNPTWNQ